ncbi:helix-turn-helix domain-containing protein [Aliarcobacter skirrowii]|uniref:helix-turn-helix domain-containing protein n=1 Tax=Aliarcobacter skirrowii TaxID=28200 RepID=UPI0029B4332B|nr:helix-turn-helix transcriptional regulator [Aliarcobacter skirrowii]MDX4028355.1 helix-turn-helix transcriptional regulator [Aliarcobacter skirrowii]
MHKNMNIHEKLRYIRFLKNINQKEFAEKLNVTQSTISKYEKNERTPDCNLIMCLVSELNVNPNWLFLDKEPVFFDKNII